MSSLMVPGDFVQIAPRRNYSRRAVFGPGSWWESSHAHDRVNCAGHQPPVQVVKVVPEPPTSTTRSLRLAASTLLNLSIF